MDCPLLVLARDDLRTTMVLLGLVVIIVSALIRKKRRIARRERADAEDAAALQASILDRTDAASQPRP